MLAEALSLTAAQMLDLLPGFVLGVSLFVGAYLAIFWVPAYLDHRRIKRRRAEEYRQAYEAIVLDRDRIGL